MTGRCTSPGCDARLPMRESYVPRPDGFYSLVYVVDDTAWREHLLTSCVPARMPLRRVS